MEHTAYIVNLLDRYWEGETTIEEERRLKAYFNSTEVDDSLLRFKPLFQVLEQDKNLVLESKAKPAPVMYSNRQSWRRLGVAAAATLVLGVGGLWFMGRKSNNSGAILVSEDQNLSRQNAVAKLPENNPTQQATSEKINQKPPVKKRKKALPVLASQQDKEAEDAIREVKAALALLSSKLSKGRGEASKGATRLDQLDRIFKKKNNNIEG